MICSKPDVVVLSCMLLLMSALAAAASRAAEPIQLTSDGYFKRDPVFWPGKNELVFCKMTASDSPFKGRVRLMRMNLDDRKVELMQPKESGADREIAVSGDGQVFAYGRFRGFNSVIVVKDLARNRSIEIKRADFVNRPTLSPKGDRIVFMVTANRLLAVDLWRGGAKDRELGVVGDIWPNYSPDGKRIVFTSRRDRNYEIYVMNADGSGEQRLTDSPGLDMNARFSPDGRQIAFASNRDGNYEVYVMNADGGHVRRVTSHPERDDFPCWHPDGRHLVVVSERKGKFDLYQFEVPRD